MVVNAHKVHFQFILIILFVGSSISALKAQVKVKDSCINAPMLAANFAFQLPGGDLAERFGYNSNIGGDFMYKTRKNWIWGFSAHFIFGNQLRDAGILDSMVTERGGIINRDGHYADVRLYERGFDAYFRFGKLFPVIGPNPNSGIVIIGGLGLLQHKIRIENIGNDSPQLDDEYKKGYDRLSNGLALNEFIGYMNMDNRRLLNFYFGLELVQGFTQNRRSYNYDTRSQDTEQRFDLLTGFRVGFIVPLYPKVPKDFYYY